MLRAAIIGACLWLFTNAVDGDDAVKDAGILHVIVLSNDRPVFIRLQLQVDGTPYQEVFDTAWHDYLQHLFKSADRNKDGGLDSAEAVRLPAPSAILTGGWGDEQDGLNFAFNFRVLDRDADGQVTLKELTAYYERYAGGPFRTQHLVGPSTLADARLFDRLDQNRDGSLSKEELASATSQLKPLDTDGDDTITAAEIAGTPTPAALTQPPPCRARGPRTHRDRVFATPSSC